jgi:hypothetical protein
LLVDPNPGVAGGPAFATTNPEHILNTVTQDMTADPADRRILALGSREPSSRRRPVRLRAALLVR